jgi:hypothetical protein
MVEQEEEDDPFTIYPPLSMEGEQKNTMSETYRSHFWLFNKPKTIVARKGLLP